MHIILYVLHVTWLKGIVAKLALTPADKQKEIYLLKKSFIEHKGDHYEDLNAFTQHPTEGGQEEIMQ